MTNFTNLIETYLLSLLAHIKAFISECFQNFKIGNFENIGKDGGKFLANIFAEFGEFLQNLITTINS